METDKNIVQLDTSLAELVNRIDNYEPTWEDLVLEFTTKEREALNIKDKEESDEN